MLENGLRGLSCDGDEYPTVCDWVTVSELEDWSLFMQHHGKSCSIVSTNGKTYWSLPAKRIYFIDLHSLGLWADPWCVLHTFNFTNTKQRGYRWRNWLFLTGLLYLEKLQSTKFDLYRQRFMLAESMKANVFSLVYFHFLKLI